MISRIKAQSTTAASISSNQDEKIQEMLGKIELNVSGLVKFRRETIELLNTQKRLLMQTMNKICLLSEIDNRKS